MTTRIATLCLILLSLAACSPEPGSSDGELQALREEVRQLRDERAIRELLHRYGLYLDGRRFEDWVQLFTADGRWVGGMGDYRGHEALRGMLESNLGTAPMEGERYRSMHFFANPIITLDGNTATANSRYLFYVADESGSPEPFLAGHYQDRLLKTEDGWKFVERRVIDDLFPASASE